MAQNLQQKYDQMKAVCKKQQAKIAKLQSEIRERYQSFYLYNSRFKKGQSSVSEPHENSQGSIKSSSELPRVNERVYSQESLQKSRAQILQEIKSTRVKSFVITKDIEIAIQPTKQDKTKEINENLITIESFKNRIAALQSNKSQAVREIQKLNIDLQQLRLKVKTLEKNNEILIKSQKKLKDKLKKIPEYEQKIDQIYIKLMKEVKRQQFDEQNQLQKHLNVKIQEIISWISQSKERVNDILEDFNRIEISANQLPLEVVQSKEPLQEVPSKATPLVTQDEQDSPQASPVKTESKIIGQNWTIISKLNEVDIKPFDASEVKPYNLSNDISVKKEEESIIKAFEQNSMIFEEELKQSKNQISELKEQLTINRNRNHQLAQDLKNQASASNIAKQEYDRKINKLLQQLESSQRKNQKLEQELNSNIGQCNLLRQQLSLQKKFKHKLNEELEKSRSKLFELQQSKMSRQVQALKDLHQKNKLNITQPDLTSSNMTVTQQLQAPYFVEQQLQTNANDEYVKRSFIRKKIVRRNLSATAYRIVSKSKQEVQGIISNKISEYRDVSREKADKLKASQKKDKALKQESLQNSVNRISEVSEPRDSGINQEEVRIIEVTTTTPGQEIRSTKIYTKGGESNLSSRRKY